MKDFLVFFLSMFTIYLLINITQNNNGMLRIVSPDDGIEYIVRDLPDSLQAVKKLSNINRKINNLLNSLENNEKNIKLKEKYKSTILLETKEDSTYTSYSVNKGEQISLCIRSKLDNKLYEEDNTIIFVMIHELAHVMSKSIGHTQEFWDNMKYLLIKAHELNIYNPIDYSENNIDYCGIKIKTTPYDF